MVAIFSHIRPSRILPNLGPISLIKGFPPDLTLPVRLPPEFPLYLLKAQSPLDGLSPFAGTIRIFSYGTDEIGPFFLKFLSVVENLLKRPSFPFFGEGNVFFFSES